MSQSDWSSFGQTTFSSTYYENKLSHHTVHTCYSMLSHMAIFFFFLSIYASVDVKQLSNPIVNTSSLW